MIRLRHSRAAAFALLAAVTLYGGWELAQGDWRAALGYWQAKLPVLPAVLALAMLDVGLEAVAALWVYRRFGVHAFDGCGVAACLALRAGLLLPAQLGRLIRPDALVRLGRGRAKPCLEAEAATFALDALGMLALVAAAAAWRWLPAAALPAAAAVLGGGLVAGRLLSGWLRGTRFALPAGFWLRPASLAAAGLEAAAWGAHAAAFWLLVRDLPGRTGLPESILATCLASVAGAGSGAPGGVGVTDGLLGAALGWMAVPVEHLALVVLGFRLATFWLWIPVGWLALLWTRKAPAGPPEAGVAS